MSDPIYFVVWFYGQRGGAENLIKEANHDAGLGIRLLERVLFVTELSSSPGETLSR